MSGNRRLVVLKFGGTSVGSPEGRQALAERIQDYKNRDIDCVIVVSAMGRKGDPYATDTLLGLVENLPKESFEMDALASVGEIISSVVVAATLREYGVAARALSGPAAGIYATDTPQHAAVTEIHTQGIVNALKAGETPVVCGFQGISDCGSTVTLGRGGSDTTACALGVALKADAVEIYSDVDGVFSADPRIVMDAVVLKEIRADELFQMAKTGSKVVHAPAAELALEGGVSLFVKNTYNDSEGTHVVDIDAYRPKTVATAVVGCRDVTRFIVKLGAQEGTLNHLKAQTQIYQKLAACNISLDMFTPADTKLMFTVSADQTDATRDCLASLAYNFDVSVDLAKITVVGAGMHGIPGVMSRIATALFVHEIDMYQAADSHTTISVLVDDSRGDDAVRALHDAFCLREGE